MARIPDSFLDTLLMRLDIVDVVERYVPLKKAGQNYMACCPFHKEKSPSFTVSQTKQFYHCFGCGAHGSAIGFLMEYANLGFVDAVEELAKGAGLTVPKEVSLNEGGKPSAVDTPGLAEIMRAAMDFYRQGLKSSPEAIAYLKARGVTGAIAARFGLGYAKGGDAWRELQQIFPDYATNEGLVACGLVIVNEEKQSRYDRFRGRIIFPIFNQRNQVIGFGGRVLGKDEPKYLNSPETVLFEKGRELYGLTHARAAIREAGKVLVVEGYMDVVALAQHQVAYAVATLGTACTPTHVQKLVKLSDEVVFCFDGDNAGRKAAWRALENSLALLQDGKKITFLFLPQGHDPDSYIQEHGKERFEHLLQNEAVALGYFLLKELTAQVELVSEEGRAKLISLAKPYLAQIRAPALSIMLKKRLAELCQLTQVEVERLLGDRKASKNKKHWQLNPHITKYTLSVEQKLLQLLLYSPNLVCHESVSLLAAMDYQSNIGKILQEVLVFIENHPNIGLGISVLQALGDEQQVLQAALNAGVKTFTSFSEEELQAEWLDTVKKFQQSHKIPATLDRRMQLEYKAANGGLTEGEKAEYLSLLTMAK